jgi:hypothetical protein
MDTRLLQFKDNHLRSIRNKLIKGLLHQLEKARSALLPQSMNQNHEM